MDVSTYLREGQMQKSSLSSNVGTDEHLAYIYPVLLIWLSGQLDQYTTEDR